MLSWIRALRERLAGPRSRATTGPSAASAAALEARLSAPSAGGGSRPEGASTDPFLPFAHALGVEPPAAPAALAPEEEAEDARVAALVVERFGAARPEPASFPALALQILNLAASPSGDAAELSRLVARDPALSAGVLSVANSAANRGRMEIETVREAVTRLGLDEVGRIAAAVSARTLFSPRLRAEQAAYGARWSTLFGHAVGVGAGAAAAALRQRGARADRAYLGGLLHDVGKSLGLRALAGLVLDGRLASPDPARLERVLDRVHVALGGEAHQAWGLPQYLTVLCVRHHDEAIPAGEDFVDLHLVRLASALADLREAPFAARAAAEIAQSAGALGLDPYAVRALAAEVRQAERRTLASFAGR